VCIGAAGVGSGSVQPGTLAATAAASSKPTVKPTLPAPANTPSECCVAYILRAI